MASFLVPNGAQFVRTAFVSCTRAPRAQIAPRTFQLLSRGCYRTYSTSNRRLSTLSAQTQNESSDPSDISSSAKSSVDRDEPEAQYRRIYINSRREDDDPETLKAWMRAVPHPVAVITARKDLSTTGAEACVGATVSSFNTVTFSPEPTVSFNLLKNSTTLKAISSTQYFNVSLLQNNSRGAKLADVFTRGNDPSPFVASTTEADHPLQFSNWKVDGLPELLPPTVRLTGTTDGEDDAPAFAILCELRMVIEVGDHVIVVGRALKTKAATMDLPTRNRSVAKQPVSSDDICLSYAHGSYSGTGLRSRRRKVWLDQDLFRDIPIDTLQDAGLRELERHYAAIASKIEAGINGRRSGEVRCETFLSRGFTVDELNQALQYHRSRYDAVTYRKEELNKQAQTETTAALDIHPPLNRLEENELRRKSSAKTTELMEERAIYQQKISQLMEMQTIPRENADAGSMDNLDNHLDLEKVEIQIQRFKRKLQILQEAIATKRGLRPSLYTINDLLPQATWEQDFLSTVVFKSLHAIRNQLQDELNSLYSTSQQRSDHQKTNMSTQDNDQSDTERSLITTARRARILQTAITLKFIANSASGFEARKYLSATRVTPGKATFRRLILDPERKSDDVEESTESREIQEEEEEGEEEKEEEQKR